ncbi:extensin-like [Humulus lupulus]|uniref:extensin-like n=1 Tax=Humulus lupulus TaxID=3486 RepID=UPI002B404F8D|nr:extensin-like [Humulus lupulus]
MATKTRAQRRKSKPSSTPPPTKKSTKVPSSSPPPAKKKSTDPSSVPPPAKQIPFVPNTTPLPLPSPATVNDPTTITTKPATKTKPTIQKSKRPTKPASAAPPPKTQKTSATTKATPQPKPTVVPTPSTKKNLVLSGPTKKFVFAQARAKYESIKTNKLLPKKGFLPTTIGKLPIKNQSMLSFHCFECAVYNDMVVAPTLDNFNKALQLVASPGTQWFAAAKQILLKHFEQAAFGHLGALRNSMSELE